jgi:hypothetical protein
MDLVSNADPPGASFDFRDVTSVFEDAAAGEILSVYPNNLALSEALDMDDDQMLFMDGFSLQDAMAAFEVTIPLIL